MRHLYVFDLDGTLYEGDAHFDYYASLLNDLLPEEKRPMFDKDYEAMKQEKHPVSIGKAYDVGRDLAVSVDPFTQVVTEAKTWDGENVDPKPLYGEEPVTFDFDNLVAIGDGWWLPFACAKHYGVSDCYPSYLKTKAYMVSDAFRLEPVPGVRECLIHLKKKHDIVLLTNSDREDVNRLLGELHLSDVFDHVITSAKKPARTMAHFKDLQQAYEVRFSEMVSIGDNFMNEIAQALVLGMRAVYIAPSPPQGSHKDLLHVTSIGEWLAYERQRVFQTESLDS